mmetsp:Transcript_16870/g.28714  ORF Transcript_16870/g.28714 Transcript_16870/m.28714 type:complete len:153 (-) Transcript_16870:60-518(-)
MFLRGCNRVGGMHPSVSKFLPQFGGDIMDRGLLHVMPVGVYSVGSLLEGQSIGSMNYVKVDTEGFDATIVHSLLDAVHSKPSLRPDHIKYEHIALDDSVRTTLQSRLAGESYACLSDDTDTTCTWQHATTPLPPILGHSGQGAAAPDSMSPA